MQNERLEQRVADLRKRAHDASSLASTSVPVTYGNTMMQPPYIPTQPAETAQPYYGMPNLGGYSSMTSDLSGGTFDGAGSSSRGPAYAWNPVMEENLSEDSMRKKVTIRLYRLNCISHILSSSSKRLIPSVDMYVWHAVVPTLLNGGRYAFRVL